MTTSTRPILAIYVAYRAGPTSHSAFAAAFQESHIDSLGFWALGSATASLTLADCAGPSALANSRVEIFFQTQSEYEWELTGTLQNAQVGVGGVAISGDGPFLDVRVRPPDFYILTIVTSSSVDGSGNPIQESGSYDVTLSFNPVSQIGVGETSEESAAYKLENAWPNPFNPTTTMAFALPKSGPTTLQVFDLRGRLVRSLIHAEWKEPGRYPVTWNARDDAGRTVPAGVYFYRLRSGDYQSTKRLVLLK